MLRHTVLLKWNDSAPPDVANQMAVALAELEAAWPTLLAYRYGPDLGLGADTWDYAISADFATEADFVEFRDDPDHKAMGQRLVVPWRGERASMQFELTD